MVPVSSSSLLPLVRVLSLPYQGGVYEWVEELPGEDAGEEGREERLG
jgi:hypothetical protein